MCSPLRRRWAELYPTHESDHRLGPIRNVVILSKKNANIAVLMGTIRAQSRFRRTGLCPSL
jgi:hypothetical protein